MIERKMIRNSRYSMLPPNRIECDLAGIGGADTVFSCGLCKPVWDDCVQHHVSKEQLLSKNLAYNINELKYLALISNTRFAFQLLEKGLIVSARRHQVGEILRKTDYRWA